MMGMEAGEASAVTSIAVRDERVYWVEHAAPYDELEGGSRKPRGSLRVAPLAPPPRPRNDPTPPFGKRITTFTGAAQLALDDKHAFLAIHDDDRGGKAPSGAIMRVPLAGGQQRMLVPFADAPQSLVLDGDHVYWVDAEGLGKVSKSGGKPTRIANVKGSRIAIDDTTIWVLERARVAKVAKADGTVTALGVTFIEEAGLAIDGDFVYGATWMGDAGKSFTSIVKVPKSGGAPIVLVRDQTYPRELTVDETHVFWINGLVGREAELRRVGKDGQGAEVMLTHEVLTTIASAPNVMVCASSERMENGQRTGTGVLLRIAK